MKNAISFALTIVNPATLPATGEILAWVEERVNAARQAHGSDLAGAKLTFKSDYPTTDENDGKRLPF